MLTATLLAIVTRKLSGFHLAVATLMFGIVVHTWLIHSGDWAGGPEGIGGIPRLSFFGWELGRTELIAIGAPLVLINATAIVRLDGKDGEWGEGGLVGGERGGRRNSKTTKKIN